MKTMPFQPGARTNSRPPVAPFPDALFAQNNDNSQKLTLYNDKLTIIPPHFANVSIVISETYNFFYHNPHPKNAVQPASDPARRLGSAKSPHGPFIRGELSSTLFNCQESGAEVRLEKRITRVTRMAPLQTPHRFLKARQGNLCFCSDAMTARPTSLKLVSAFSPTKEGRLHV
jgi:hypothetical protein